MSSTLTTLFSKKRAAVSPGDSPEEQMRLRGEQKIATPLNMKVENGQEKKSLWDSLRIFLGSSNSSDSSKLCCTDAGRRRKKTLPGATMSSKMRTLFSKNQSAVSLTIIEEQIKGREGWEPAAPKNAMVQNTKRKSHIITPSRLSSSIMGTNRDSVAGASAPVFIVSLSDSSSSEIMDEDLAHDDDAGDTTSPVTRSIRSNRVSRAKPDPFSTEEGNYNPIAEELAHLSIVSFSTSDRSSATTDYGSFAVRRELSPNSSCRTSTATGQ